MSATDDLRAANARYSDATHLDKRPGRKIAVLTCMDTRLDLHRALGLEVGDAHFLRNAGGLVTPDVLRSLTISQRALGTQEVVVIGHTDCGMLSFDDAAFRSSLAVESGRQPPWDTPGFSDVEVAVRASVDRLRTCAWLPSADAVTGFVYDVETGALTEV